MTAVMNYETTLQPASHDAVFDADVQDSQPPRRWRKIALVVAAILVVASLGYWLFGGPAEPKPFAPSDAQVPTVSVIAPGRATIEGEITATGTLAARRTMPVGSVGEGGQVVSVRAEAGQWVRQGQVLAVVDRSVQNQQAAGQAAQIQVARSDAQLAQSNLDRASKLVDKGFISTADVDRLTATRDAANARVRVAQAQLSELRARSARLNIVAPAAGLVLERNVEPGQVVSGGSGPLFSIAKGGEMELLAQVGEEDLGRLSTGVSAEVTPVGSDRTFQGQVWQLAPIIQQQSRQGTARIALPYADALRPGGFATAVIRSGTVVAPVLPESAIQSDNQGSYVYVVGKDAKVARRGVKIGSVTGNGITIIQGLNGTERVVMRAGGFLSAGDKVKAVLERPSAGRPPTT